ncbi:protein ERGIC-53-like isoform X2 [Octopus vulgaris]|uniref:Protein ERGIC-53-like isoform X2 n=2 Tax=Octopus TaxID=6643 RepID=A0AA36FB67_OCTVU|nr:protein ERGIC-53 [Octopus sinensis]CAI9732606.1 protein ERGIC-53-like isoform X2 [Octopus vulgaris]
MFNRNTTPSPTTATAMCSCRHTLHTLMFLISLTLIVVVWSTAPMVSASVPRLRFEYKLSFKGPHLIQKDKSIPFWEYGGDAIAGDENIRVTTSLKSKKGWVWTKNPVPHDNWVIEVTFRVTGRGRVGADGLAIWYTLDKAVEGPVFGNMDKWNGMGLFFDSFDNDGQRNNPYILVMLNNGTREYDHMNDGHDQQLGGCLRDFRNKPFPLKARVEYYKNSLTVFIHNGMSSNQNEYELCLRAEGIHLPKNGFFGVTAATGGLADDHDVMAFLTHSMHAPADQMDTGTKVSEDEKKKLDEEFKEYYKKLEQAKEDFKKENPDKAKDEYDIDVDKWFESQGERELKQIFEGQNSIYGTLRELNKRLDELSGRQELILSKVTSIQAPVAGQPPIQHAQGTGIPMDTIRRHEVDMVINNQNDFRAQMKDIRQLIGLIKEKADHFSGVGATNDGKAPGGGSGANMQLQMALHEVKDTIKQVRTDTANILNTSQGSNTSCPNINCISPKVFFIGLSVQIAALFIYAMYKQSKEAQAKKFY